VRNRLRFAEKVAGVAALVLLGSLFLGWFGPDIRGAYFDRSVGAQAEAGVFSFTFGSASGWDSLGWLALGLVVLAIVAGLAVPLVFAVAETAVLPLVAAIVALVVGLLATLALLVQVVFQPGDDAATTVLSGWWIGFLAAAGVARGGFLSMRDEYLPGVPIPDVEVRPAPPAVPAA